MLCRPDHQGPVDGDGGRHPDNKGGAFADLALDAYITAHFLQLGENDIHAHAAAGNLADGIGGGKPLVENQALGLLVAKGIHIDVQPLAQSRFPHGLGIDPAAVVTEGDDGVRAGLADIDGDLAGSRFTGLESLLFRLYAVVQGVAHHVLQYRLAAGIVIPVQGTQLIQYLEGDGLTQVDTHCTHQSTQPGHQPGNGNHPGGANGGTDRGDNIGLLLEQGLYLDILA